MPQYPTMQIPSRLPLVVSTSNRGSSTNTDARLVNCYLETDTSTGDIFICKRPGIFSAGVIADGKSGQGVFFWEGSVYSVFDGVFYRDGVQVATGLDNTGGVYQFSSILGATHKMVLNNGKQGYAYDVVNGLSANLHSINVSYPQTTVKGWAYLNGAQYVMNPEAVIWGSAINSVSQAGDWNALNFISAQMEPDPGVALNRQLVYVVAFNSWSTEVFFDAGNAQGSPLGNVQGSKQSYGCASADSIQRIDDVLFWISTNESAQIQVAKMERLGLSIISTAPIDRLLKNASLAAGQVMSWQIKINGHSFYVLTVKSLNLTLAYDIVENRWDQWTDSDGNYFPIVASTYDSQGRHVLQHESDGRLYYMDSAYFSDGASEPIVVDIYTPIFDASTRRGKSLSMMEIVGDQVTGSMLMMQYSDDDYQTWSKPRYFFLGQKRPIMSELGTFSKRAFHFRHEKDCHFRIQAVEVQYDLGVI
jgi:hypothetical protein